MRSINREFCRFIFWGGINTLSGYLLYALMLQLLPYLVAYTIVFIVSIFISYLLNSKFVFKQKLEWSKALKYPLVYAVQYLLGIVSLYLLVRLFRVDKLLAPIIIVVFTIPVTYVLSRRIVAPKTAK
jgi:putative flippase GtrA